MIVRPGWRPIGPGERHWCNAWRYVNHLQSMYAGDLIVVTEHGWCDLMTGWAAPAPRLELPACA